MKWFKPIRNETINLWNTQRARVVCPWAYHENIANRVTAADQLFSTVGNLAANLRSNTMAALRDHEA